MILSVVGLSSFTGVLRRSGRDLFTCNVLYARLINRLYHDSDANSWSPSPKLLQFFLYGEITGAILPMFGQAIDKLRQPHSSMRDELIKNRHCVQDVRIW